MGGLSDLCFDPGVEFAKVVSQCFGCSVSPSTSPPSAAFRLVVSFGHSVIRLNEESIGLILQACLGGVAKDYNVFHLSGWMFGFLVSCKKVGIMIHKLKSSSCKSFAIFFFLWRDGGANWQKEYDLWCLEQEAEWTLVNHK